MTVHIFLYGLPGSGKSTVGKLLAESLNRTFLDLDQLIESDSMPIAHIVTDQGEKAFRNQESNALRKAIMGVEKVISLGGGTLLLENNRLLAESTGNVIVLDVDLPTLIFRLSQDHSDRPLLVGDLQIKLETLFNERKAHYDSFSLHINASPKPEEIAWAIQCLLGNFHIGGMGQGYDVIVEKDSFGQFGDILTSRGVDGRVMVVSDTNVAPLYLNKTLESFQGSGISSKTLILPAGEVFKTLETASFIWRSYLDAELDRSSAVVALGGGVVGDLVGFTSSTYLRGITWVNVPTTLLAMVDASIGGKTGINLPQGKNLIGSFYSPTLVLPSLNSLETLSEVELRSGMAEIVKHGVIADPDLFENCSVGIEKLVDNIGQIVRKAMAVKIKIIKEDPYEMNTRASLNFGHTVGHAVELVSGYKIRHGEAVSIGMVTEARIAERLSLADKGLTSKLVEVLETLDLPVRIPDNFSKRAIVHAMEMDKKKSKQGICFSLPVRIGEIRTGVVIENLEAFL